MVKGRSHGRSWKRPGDWETFRSLHVRNYRLFFSGHAVSVCGTWMQRVAQDWLVFTLTGSGVALGIAAALQFGPMVVLGIWGGSVVDRFDRRRLLIATQVTQAVLALALGLLTVSGLVALWMVYALTFLLGVVTVIDSPARAARTLVRPKAMVAISIPRDVAVLRDAVNKAPMTAPRPSATPLPVRVKTSQSWATRCIHVPQTETAWPETNSR
jgi:hypothetical protein